MPTTIDYRVLIDDLSDDSTEAANDPVLDAFQAGVDLDAGDLRRISTSVRWVRGARPQSSLPIDRFHATKFLALLDLYGSRSERDKKELVHRYLKSGTSNTNRLSALRATKAYGEICEKLLAAQERLHSPATPESLVDEGVEDAFRALGDEVRTGQGKTRIIAAKEFTDRAAPKIAKGESTGRALMLEMGIAQLLNDTLKLVSDQRAREIEGGGQAKLIEGAVGTPPDD